MPRPKSQDKRSAIIDAATRVIVSQGLSAPTALIAKEAGIANGSLFTYFATKTELYNQLYLELKTEMARTAIKNMPADGNPRDRLFTAWQNWTTWSTKYPDKRKAMGQLAVCDEITGETRAAGHRAMQPIVGLLEEIRANGSMSKVPMPFVGGLMNSIAEATMDYMAQDPKKAKEHAKVGFEALWRLIS